MGRGILKSDLQRKKLNVDYNFFITVLAAQLKKCASDIILIAQTVYIPKRNIKVNSRFTIKIIEQEGNGKKLHLWCGKKPFDNLQWQFLLAVLNEIRVPSLRQNHIPMANNEDYVAISTDFQISKYSRQGCPLFLLLFIITVIMLAGKASSDKQISIVKIHGDRI